MNPYSRARIKRPTEAHNQAEKRRREEERKLEEKRQAIRTEFEKFQKEQKLNVDENAKHNEAKFRSLLDNIHSTNDKKVAEEKFKIEMLNNLKQQNMETSMFNQTMTKILPADPNKFPEDDEELMYSTFGSPPRNTSVFTSTYQANQIEAMGDRVADLKDQLRKIQLMTEQEERNTKGIQQKYEELRADKFLQNKRLQEVKKIIDHSDKRFRDLEKISFLAQNKCAATINDLRDYKQSVQELEQEEAEFLNKKKKMRKDEERDRKAVQTHMSKVLIDLDINRVENEKKEEMLKQLTNKAKQMEEKEEEKEKIMKVIDILEEIDKFLKRIDNPDAEPEQEQVESEKSVNFSFEINSEPARKSQHDKLKQRSESERRNSFAGSPGRKKSSARNSPLKKAIESKKAQSIERETILAKIHNFNLKFPDGPNSLIDVLLERYEAQSIRETSLQNIYHEYQQQIVKRERELANLQEQYDKLQENNPYLQDQTNKQRILEQLSPKDSIDSGIMLIKNQLTTLNQARQELDHTTSSETMAELFKTTESFLLRCYLDVLEALNRLAKLVVKSLYEVDQHNVPVKLERIVTEIIDKVNDFRHTRKPIYSTSTNVLDANNEIRTQSGNTTQSEREAMTEPSPTLDINDVFKLFVNLFDDSTGAQKFADALKKDNLINSFLSMEEIKTYLLRFQNELSNEDQIDKALHDTQELRDLATENILRRFKVLFKCQKDLTNSLAEHYLRLKDKLSKMGFQQAIPYLKQKDLREIMSRATVERIEDRFKALKDKFGIDPGLDYRDILKYEAETEDTDNEKPKFTKDMDNDSDKDMNNDDLKVKIDEIVYDAKLKSRGYFYAKVKTPFYEKQKTKEEAKIQIRQEEEKRKMMLAQMSDMEYLDDVRDQMKKAILNRDEGPKEDKGPKGDGFGYDALMKSTPLIELGKMIQSSKMLSKIQILENQRSIADGKKNLKKIQAENYIPHEIDPKRSSQYWRPKTESKMTRSIEPSFHKQGHQNSSETEIPHLKPHTTKSSSRFKPNNLSDDFQQQPVSNTQPQVPSLKLKKRPEKVHQSQKLPSTKEKKSQKLLINTISEHKFPPVDKKFKSHTTKAQHQTSLPNLKLRPHKKAPNKHIDGAGKVTSIRTRELEKDNLEHLLDLQTDPMLKSVYTPSFFATSFPSVHYTDDMSLNYRFDSYKVKVPSVLISNKAQ